ncbi:MAG: hypothetical protein GX271_08740 [Clostridiales bacterium]|nr:hypothetical protein [Clostridiales bacterium]
MLQLLELRERIKNFYQRYDAYLLPVVKFIFAFIAFQAINKEIGYDERLKSLPIILGISLLSAFTPSAVMVLLAAVISVLHVYFISPILSVMIIVILMILYLLFARYTPKYGYVLLAVPILFLLKIPYIIPILLGLISTPVAMIPTSCGVIIYFLFQIIKSAITMQVNISIEDIIQLYTHVIDSLTGNRQMIMTVVIFSLTIMVTYFIRKMSFDYAFEISILAGGLTGILGFLISYLILNQSKQILSMILGTIVSIALVYIIHFFKLTLDYSGVEYAQFEDDVYYYYVKAVPKVTVTVPQVNVKHINVKSTERREFSDPDVDEAEDYGYDE